MSQFGGFLPIPVAVTPKTKHYIYVKKHQSKNDIDYADRAIFAVNLPQDTTFNALKSLCQQLGNTILEEFVVDPYSPTRGIFVLVDKAACSRFLAKAKKAQATWRSDSLTGSELYCDKIAKSFPSQDDLKLQANQFMEEFAQREREEAAEVRNMRQKVDEDGFTMVVSSKRKLADSQAAAAANASSTNKTSTDSLADPSTTTNKKKNKEHTDFYRFQIREQKKFEMNSLLRRFQDDKKKVEEMRQRKRFKPY